MKLSFQKVKMVHHIIPEFAKILSDIEKNEKINRIIPGRISRQQKGSSTMRFRITIPTNSGFKCIMSKGATAQELFIICDEKHIKEVKDNILNIIDKFKF